MKLILIRSAKQIISGIIEVGPCSKVKRMIKSPQPPYLARWGIKHSNITIKIAFINNIVNEKEIVGLCSCHICPEKHPKSRSRHICPEMWAEIFFGHGIFLGCAGLFENDLRIYESRSLRTSVRLMTPNFLKTIDFLLYVFFHTESLASIGAH